MKQSYRTYSRGQLLGLVALRVVIGWYFLYEGLAKVFTPNWSSYGYLMDSQGFFSGMFKSLAQCKVLMPLIDVINIYGLIVIGLLLILGLWEKIGYIGAIFLLVLYYLSHPALLDTAYLLPSEGAYLWVNKNVVMLVAVVVLMLFPSGRRIGLDRLIFKNRKS